MDYTAYLFFLATTVGPKKVFSSLESFLTSSLQYILKDQNNKNMTLREDVCWQRQVIQMISTAFEEENTGYQVSSRTPKSQFS